MKRRRITTCLAGIAAVLGLGLAQSGTPAEAASQTAAPAATPVVEYYAGHVYTLTPGNWHGATDCAIQSAHVAHCFDNNADFAAFTTAHSTSTTPNTSTDAVQPAATGTCNGWLKIWDGANFTNRGLAFEDYGSLQYLSSYVNPPFNLRSWFTDGQRGYSRMTNCYGFAFDVNGNFSVQFSTNAQANSLGPAPIWSIQLYQGTR